MATYDDVDRTICLTGPECTGKTTLAAALAEHFGAALVPEVAREYLEGRVDYQRDDVLEIARLQMAAEREARAAHSGLLFCDTDLLVLQIWWREKYGALPKAFEQDLPERALRGYLLLSPDLPWESDPQRENPIDRDRLFELHRTLLAGLPFPHRIVEGLAQARFDCALEQLHALIAEL